MSKYMVLERMIILIYLDNNATTSVSQSVFEAMTPYLTTEFGNPSSTYSFGAKNKNAINIARQNIASALGCEANEIIFTNGGSESNCTAIMSCVRSFPHKTKIITSSVEHASIMETMNYLEKTGYTVKYVPVDENGCLDYQFIESEVDDNTCLVSVMLANNETGCVNNVQRISKLAHSAGSLMHSDAVQGFSKIKIDVKELDVDFLSISGHKFHAPKGVGALYVKTNTPFVPTVFGHQERGMRGGTENVAYIVGVGVAAQEAKQKLENYISYVTELRDYFEKQLLSRFPDVMIHGRLNKRIANTSNFSFKGLKGEEIVLFLAAKGICLSTGSACNSVMIEPSYVLRAMNVPQDYLRSMRVSFSAENTVSEIDYFLNNLSMAVNNFMKIKEKKENGSSN